MSQYHNIGGRKVRIPNEVLRKRSRKAVENFLEEQAKADKSLKAALKEYQKEEAAKAEAKAPKSSSKKKSADTKDESKQEDDS